MSTARFTTRFRLEDPRERDAAEYLRRLPHGEQNRFMVEAVLSRLSGEDDRLRRILREELTAMFSSAGSLPLLPPDGPPESREEDGQSILEDLALFG